MDSSFFAMNLNKEEISMIMIDYSKNFYGYSIGTNSQTSHLNLSASSVKLLQNWKEFYFFSCFTFDFMIRKSEFSVIFYDKREKILQISGVTGKHSRKITLKDLRKFIRELGKYSKDKSRQSLTFIHQNCKNGNYKDQEILFVISLDKGYRVFFLEAGEVKRDNVDLCDLRNTREIKMENFNCLISKDVEFRHLFLKIDRLSIIFSHKSGAVFGLEFKNLSKTDSLILIDMFSS